MRAGERDTSYGVSGVNIVHVGGDGWAATGATLLSGGSVVVAGNTDPWRGEPPIIRALRLTIAGEEDVTFGTGGLASVPNRPWKAVSADRARPTVWAPPHSRVTAMAAQPDGRIVLAAETPTGHTDYRDFLCLRLDANGTLDHSFGTFGYIGYGIGGDDVPSAVAVQPDGKIVLAGWSQQKSSGGGAQVLERSFAVLRLNPDGSLDTTFLGKGYGVYGIGGDAWAQAVAIQPDGKIIVAGWSVPRDLHDRYFVALRLNADGTQDSGFADRGWSFQGGGNNWVTAIALQADEKVVLAGVTVPDGSDAGNVAVLRLTPDGQKDTTFGVDGRSVHDLGDDAYTSAVAIQTDGKIVVGASVLTTGSVNHDFATVRLNPDGSRDTSFGAQGLSLQDLGGDDWVTGLSIQADGNIVLCGWTASLNYHLYAATRLLGA